MLHHERSHLGNRQMYYFCFLRIYISMITCFLVDHSGRYREERSLLLLLGIFDRAAYRPNLFFIYLFAINVLQDAHWKAFKVRIASLCLTVN
jgi:hypothetical protein